jgi:hypothetical protein
LTDDNLAANAEDYDGTPANGSEDGQTGVIVVRKRDVRAFIELLGKLIANPAAVDHEPEIFGVDGAAHSATD